MIYMEQLEKKFQEEKNWKTIVDDFQDGFILMKNNSTELFYMNQSAYQIFGIDDSLHH